MLEILLSLPDVYLYLALVAVLLVAAIWTRETARPVGGPRAAPSKGQGAGALQESARLNLDKIRRRSPGLQPEHDGLPYRNLHATLSADYAAKLDQAIRTIRL